VDNGKDQYFSTGHIRSREPVNKNGWFNPIIAPGAYARQLIMAFDPSTGEKLTADKINDAGLLKYGVKAQEMS